VELDSRRVDHRVLNCEASASTAIAAVSLDQWEPKTTTAALQPSQRSADCCSRGGVAFTLGLSRKPEKVFWGVLVGLDCSFFCQRESSGS